MVNVCGCVILSALVVLAACSNRSTPGAGSGDAAGSAVPHAVLQPAARSPHVVEALARMAAIRDEMCKCTNRPCTDVVSEHLERYGKELDARTSLPVGTVTETDKRDMAALTDEMTRCLTTALMAGLTPAEREQTLRLIESSAKP